MKIHIGFIAAAAVLVGACATEPYPMKRPLSQENVALLGETNVVVVENNSGVTTSWFMQDSSAAGASYGLIGALVTATMDAIMNAGPSARAQKAADELAEVAFTEKLNQSLRQQFDLKKAAADAGSSGIGIGEVTTIQKILSPNPLDDAVEVSVNYKLSEDASAMNVVASATYQRAGVKYVTPYKFKSVPKPELEGPLYRNTFTYESNRFPLPALTPELKQEMIASIQRRYANETGMAPVEGDEYKKMTKELEEAKDDKLSKSEASVFLVREWVKNDGSVLYREMEKAHAFIAKYLLIDLNSTTVPSLQGVDQQVEQLEDGRTVRVIGSSTAAGSYVSSPGGLKDFTTFGNAIQIAKTNREKVKTLQAAADTKRASK